MTTTDTTPRICVGTYAKYNDGSIEGKWLDLTDYSSKDEFYEACKELHSDEQDPEFMFQDWENIPAAYVGESWIDENVFQVIEILQKLESMDDSELVSIHNQYCDSTNRHDDQIHYNNEDFLETYFAGKISDAISAAIHGDYNLGSDWVTFNGYGNLQSIHNVRDYIDTDEISKDILENPGNYSL